jgi:sodium transport system ATP-binding protein
VALARALVHDPQNVLLDEPTNGLDVMSTRAVRDIIRACAIRARCVLFSSHVMQEVSALCDAIVVDRPGRVVAHGTPNDCGIRPAGQLEDAFVALAGLEGGELHERGRSVRQIGSSCARSCGLAARSPRALVDRFSMTIGPC